MTSQEIQFALNIQDAEPVKDLLQSMQNHFSELPPPVKSHLIKLKKYSDLKQKVVSFKGLIK